MKATISLCYYAKLGWNVVGLDKFKGQEVTVMEIAL